MNRRILAFPLRKIIEVALGVYNIDDHFIVDDFGKFPVVVDLGAGNGKFPSVILAKHPSSKIILVEPRIQLDFENL